VGVGIETEGWGGFVLLRPRGGKGGGGGGGGGVQRLL